MKVNIQEDLAVLPESACANFDGISAASSCIVVQ
jgi:hypothetical protein